MLATENVAIVSELFGQGQVLMICSQPLEVVSYNMMQVWMVVLVPVLLIGIWIGYLMLYIVIGEGVPGLKAKTKISDVSKQIFIQKALSQNQQVGGGTSIHFLKALFKTYSKNHCLMAFALRIIKI